MLDIRAGSRIGPYKVITPLEESARGGMSTLFLAQLAQVDSKQLLLLKVVPIEEGGGEGGGIMALNALRKEIELLQRLRHPGIVKVYPIPARNGRREYYISRASNVPGKPWFCAMEYLEGGSLESRLQEGTVIPTEEAVEIAYQIGTALDYMHAKGFVHWDVKPDNILFREVPTGNGEVEAVLTDFGIARSTHEPAAVTGSIPYMSPERLRVHLGEIPTDQVMDQRPADVYALGVVLYEMLAGSLPYAAETNEQLKPSILHDSPIPLSDFNYEVPPVLESVIFRALEKDPARRPNIEEMVTLIDKAVPAPRVVSQELMAAGAGEAAGEAMGAVEPWVRRRRPREEEAAPKPEPRPSMMDRLGQLALFLVAAGAVALVAWLLAGDSIFAREPRISGVTPSSVSTEQGIVSVALDGENLRDGMEVELMDGSGSRIPCVGVTVFDGGKRAECSIDVSDASGGNGQLRVRTDDGMASRFLTVDKPTPTPVPTSTPVPLVVDAGGAYEGTRTETIRLDARGSQDPDGRIETFAWQLDGKQVYTGPDSVYDLDLSDVDPGEHALKLIVTDDQGNTDERETTLTVANTPPTADAGGPYEIGRGEMVTLDGSGSEDPDGEIEDYSWEIGGEEVCSEVSCEIDPTEYDLDEDNQVTLTVTDADGETAESMTTFAMAEAPPRRDDDDAAPVSADNLAATGPASGACYESSPTLSWSGGAAPYTVIVNGRVVGTVSGSSAPAGLGGGDIGGVDWSVQSADGQTAGGNFFYGPGGGCSTGGGSQNGGDNGDDDGNGPPPPP